MGSEAPPAFVSSVSCSSWMSTRLDIQSYCAVRRKACRDRWTGSRRESFNHTTIIDGSGAILRGKAGAP